MKKIILILIFIFLLLFLFPSAEAGGPAKISLVSLKVYEIGPSHTPGSDKTTGTLKCDVDGAGDIDATCDTEGICTCNALVQENYYYRIEYEITNTGATLDDFWGYYDSIEELNGTVSSSSDIWIVEAETPEVCANSDWYNNRLTWVETDSGCSLELINNATGSLSFIIQIGSGATDTSGGYLHGEEDVGATIEVAYVNITVVSALTCSVTPSALSFGTLNTSSVSETTDTATTTISAGGAVRLDIYDWGDNINLAPGLWNSTSGPDTIVSPNAAEDATATLQSGVEGYGIIAATTTAGSGTLTTTQRYNSFYLSGFDPDAVGGLEWGTGSAVIIASSSAAVDDIEIVVTHKAAISASTLIGDYKDTIIYTCATY